jgi:hypothetical protein
MQTQKVWTVAEAKAKLSEILRLASEEGPQRIGTHRAYVVVPEEQWLKVSEPPVHMGRWLLENLPRGFDDLELPDRKEPDRPNPFVDILEGDKDSK